MNWGGGSSSNIDHAAIIVKMLGHNPYVAQHTSNTEEPIYKVRGIKHSWQASPGDSHLRIWVANPAYT